MAQYIEKTLFEKALKETHPGNDYSIAYYKYKQISPPFIICLSQRIKDAFAVLKGNALAVKMVEITEKAYWPRKESVKSVVKNEK